MIILEKLHKVQKLIRYKYQNLRLRLRKKPKIRIDREVPLISLGTHYGGWKIPEGFLHKDSVCYFAGAGIDISFDVEVAKTFGTKVHIIDPTPLARQHFDTLVKQTRKGGKLEIARRRDLFYEVDSKTLELLQYLDVGLWSSDTTIKFYEPADSKNMVSHSALNLHKTDSYFEAEVVRVGTLMKRLKHTRVDFLKIDIEGAEYEVIENVLKDGIKVGVWGIEFDEVHHPLDNKSIERIEQAVENIREAGYLVVDVDSHYNVTFLHQAIYDKLYSEN